MTVYTYSQARQKLASLLEEARRTGAVQIKRRDGQLFVVRPELPKRSPLDVPAVELDLSADEIVGFVRESRERSGARSRTAPTHAVVCEPGEAYGASPAPDKADERIRKGRSRRPRRSERS